MNRVIKPYRGTPGPDGKLRRYVMPLGTPGVVKAAPPLETAPLCRRCGVPTLTEDETRQPLCDLHGFLTRRIAPDHVTVAGYGLWRAIEAVVDEALR